jgi:peptidoglycan/xylan/chitin deacetylase (PgdA/CDA1 family)
MTLACLSVDVEQDCPPYLSTWRGIAEGLPPLLDLLAAHAITATFFVTGDTARTCPAAIERIVERGHELGCHGNTHRAFTSLDEPSAREELAAATRTLLPFAPMAAFRAPYLRMPRRYVPLLEDYGYSIDSSAGRHKSLAARVEQVGGVTRIPASMTSSTLRWPAAARNALLTRAASPLVLFVHPWEFVDFRATNLRFDCRFRTGQVALKCLEDTILFLRGRVEFHPIGSVAKTLHASVAGAGIIG